MACKGIGGDGCLRAADDNDITDSLVNNLCRMSESNHSPRGLGTNVTTITTSAMTNGDLTNAGGIEPGNGFIGAHIFRAFFPAKVQLLLAKGVASCARCENCANT